MGTLEIWLGGSNATHRGQRRHHNRSQHCSGRQAAAQQAAEEAAAKQKAAQQWQPTEDPDAAFQQFMAEEDGEDDLNDPSYQESAAALSGATGWKQETIEGNANKGIQSLTSAIGGRKVVGALQGMLGGLR